MKSPWKNRGSALLIVLLIITSGFILISSLFGRSNRDLKIWVRDRDKLQARYLAESGIAHLIFEKINYPDTLEKENDDTDFIFDSDLDEEEEPGELIPFQFHFDPDLPKPSMSRNEDGSFLTLTSTGTFKEQSVTVRARFGRSLRGRVFAPAIVLPTYKPIHDGLVDRVQGKISITGPNSFPYTSKIIELPKTFNFFGLTKEYVADLKEFAAEEFELMLEEEGGRTGNGFYNKGNMPNFSLEPKVFHTLGDIIFENEGGDCLTIQGPGEFYASGEIYAKGCIRFNDISMYAGKDVHFQDSISSSNLKVYTQGQFVILDNCHLDIQALSERNIIIEKEVQTTLTSTLISIGIEPIEKKDSIPNKIAYGIQIKDEAVIRGLIIAAGQGGYVEILTSENMVEGIIIANKYVWNSGKVHGSILTMEMKCSEFPDKHCMPEDGKVIRNKLPTQMVLPLELGKDEFTSLNLKLMDWVYQ